MAIFREKIPYTCMGTLRSHNMICPIHKWDQGYILLQDYGILFTNSRIMPQPCTINPSPPEQNGHHFTDDIFRCIFINEKFFLYFDCVMRCVFTHIYIYKYICIYIYNTKTPHMALYIFTYVHVYHENATHVLRCTAFRKYTNDPFY